MTPLSELIVLADTNAVYKLYFFCVAEVFPMTGIVVDGAGAVEFHPYVLDEVDAHLEAMRTLKEYGHQGDGVIPKFMHSLNDADLNSLRDFVVNNLSAKVVKVETSDTGFQNARRAYNAEKNAIQKQRRESALGGNKTKSQPSFVDYSILYSADQAGFKLLTNDEILLAVAEAFLESGCTYRTEDIINLALKANPELKAAVERAVTNLEFVGERIIRMF